ncbi:MAG: amidohydrolase [Oscillibacter sp.]|nr:amidohydrolase [Oscillibacter sp.]
MDSLIHLARQEGAYLSAVRRELHRHPELALREYRTASVIERELDAAGIPHSRVGETSVLGTLEGSGTGPVIGLRADIDALPIQEETGADYRSETDGVMHACGHDVHTACLLGAAKLLARHRDAFPGQVRLLFQSAEETGGGAMDFVVAGVLSGVERVFGLHVAPDLPQGTVGLKPGLNNAAVDHFLIKIHGRAAHVSTPHLGADALYAASQLVVAIQGIAARRTSPVEPVILGVGKLSAGTTYNAVAEYAEMEGTTRTVSQEARLAVRERIDEAACHIAAVSGAEAEVIWTGICSSLVNDPTACVEAGDTARTLGFAVTDSRPLSLGGDNFSEYLYQVPGCYAYLGTGNPAYPNTLAGIHNGRFDIDEAVLPMGAALYAACALRWLTGGTVETV